MIAMRSFSKKQLAVAGTATVILVGGSTAAYAYWTSTGGGTGDGATAAGSAALVVTQDTLLAGMYPGDSPQDLQFTVTNGSVGDPSTKVYGVTAYVTTDKGGCDGTDFLINGTPADSAVTLAWTPVEIVGGSSETSVLEDNDIQFNNKATEQNDCKNAAVTITYAAQ